MNRSVRPPLAMLIRCALVFSLVPCLALARQKEKPSPLIGSWQSENKANIVTFRPDGTGKNADGSRFRWRLVKGTLLSRTLAADGTMGPEVGAPIAFTRDSKEYTLRFERGKLKVVFYRLTRNGRRFADRTRQGRQYPSQPKPKGDLDPDSDTLPSRIVPKKGAKDDSGDTAETRPALYRVGTNVQVSKAYPKVLHSEVILAADPAHQGCLVAASMFAPPPIDPAAPKLVVYASNDGGLNWLRRFERKDKNPKSLADPTFAVGPDGTLYFGNMFWEEFSATEGQRIQCARSRDGGKTWEEAGTVEGWHDRPFLTVDTTAGTHHGRLYCLAMNGLFASTDGGTTFSIHTTWTTRSGFQATGSGTPVVLSDGCLITLHNSCYEGKSKQLKPPAALSGLLSVRRSTDGGKTLSEEQIVSPYNFDRLLHSNVPVMAADLSTGPYRDRLYVAWNDVLPAGGTGVFLSYSADRGQSWSAPRLLSEQPPGRAGFSAFVPAVSVNKAGVVGVCWYDTRGIPTDKAGWNFRFRASLDGGITWQPSVRLSEVSSLFTLKRRATPPTERQKAAYQPGHTSGLCADGKGVFHTLWIDARSGVQQVWTASIAINMAP
jgi:hypothetical protein